MNDVRQQMIERIGEDESLTGDLAGDAAEQLRQWANDTALTIAQRDDLDDETVQLQIKAVRTAARKAAAHDGDLTVAQQTLAVLIHTASTPSLSPAVVVLDTAPSTMVHPPAVASIPANHTTTEPATVPAHQPVLLRLHGWWRSMWARVIKEE